MLSRDIFHYLSQKTGKKWNNSLDMTPQRGKEYYIIPTSLRRFLLKMVHIELELAAARAHDKSISKKEQEIAHEAAQTFLDALAMLTYAEGGCVC